jgi:hypothetical protein
MRLCPLAHVELPCPLAQPLCPWCAQAEAKVEAAIQPAPENPSTKSSGPQRVCVDCKALYVITSNRQERCPACGAQHQKAKNAQYQQSFRRRKAISS